MEAAQRLWIETVANIEREPQKYFNAELQIFHRHSWLLQREQATKLADLVKRLIAAKPNDVVVCSVKQKVLASSSSKKSGPGSKANG